MKKNEKQKYIKHLRDIFLNNKHILISSIDGLSANEIYEIRKILYPKNIKFKIIKNKIAKIATKNTKMEPMMGDFFGSTTITWGNIDFITIVKTLVNVQKNTKITIKSGYYNKKRINIENIKLIALTPSLQKSKIKIIKLIKIAAERLLIQINSPANTIILIVKKKLLKHNHLGV